MHYGIDPKIKCLSVIMCLKVKNCQETLQCIVSLTHNLQDLFFDISLMLIQKELTFRDLTLKEIRIYHFSSFLKLKHFINHSWTNLFANHSNQNALLFLKNLNEFS